MRVHGVVLSYEKKHRDSSNFTLPYHLNVILIYLNLSAFHLVGFHMISPLKSCMLHFLIPKCQGLRNLQLTTPTGLSININYKIYCCVTSFLAQLIFLRCGEVLCIEQ